MNVSALWIKESDNQALLAVIRHSNRRLILKILSHSGQIGNNIDTEADQERLGAETKKLEDLWCMKSPYCEYHLLRSADGRQIRSFRGQERNASGPVASNSTSATVVSGMR